MTSASNHDHHPGHSPRRARRPGRRRSLPAGRPAAAIAALLGLAVLAGGCGGSDHAPASAASSGGLTGQFLAYARCMRGHGVPNFPDPTTSGGVGIVLPSGLSPNSPAFIAAGQACQALAPAAHPTTGSVPKLAAELKMARCMRSHGVASFPDPTGQGLLTTQMVTGAGVDLRSPAVLVAVKACLPSAGGAITGQEVQRALNGGQ